MHATHLWFIVLFRSVVTFYLQDDSEYSTDAEPCNAGCKNGGQCLYGGCTCPYNSMGLSLWGGSDCSVPQDACRANGFVCSPNGQCNTGSATCQCNSGWHGPNCEYPSTCSMTCANGGQPRLVPGNPLFCTCDCTYALSNYGGPTCSNCQLDCGRGSPQGSCTLPPCDVWIDPCSSCTCPQWWTGPKCNTPYIQAQILLSTNTQSSNINLGVYSNKSAYLMWAQSYVLPALALTSSTYTSTVTVSDAQAQGNSVLVTIQFTGATSVATQIRDNLLRSITDPNSAFTISPAGAAVQGNTFKPQNPPTGPDNSNRAAYLASIIVPVLVGAIILGLVIYCVVTRCKSGGGGGGGGGAGTSSLGSGSVQSPSRIPNPSQASGDIPLDSRHDVNGPLRDRGETSGINNLDEGEPGGETEGS